MDVTDKVAIVVGFFIICLTLFDVFTSVIEPRPVSSTFRLSANLVRFTWPRWRTLALSMNPAWRRENFLAVFAPLVVVALLALWEVALIFGFALVFYGLRREIHPVPANFGEAIYFSGSSLLTIGYGDFVPTGGFPRLCALAAGTTGLATLATVLAFLFSLFGSFQQRELFVVTLDARGSAPPSGVALLETHAQLQLVDDLPNVFVAGQRWSAQVLDNHLAFPLLAFFRSSHVDVSWLSALGAVLDAATLIISSIEGLPKGQAIIMHSMGSHLTHDLSKYFRFADDGGGKVEFQEYQSARQRLATAGFTLGDEHQGWIAFERLRGEYASALNAMARYWAITPAQWIGDRSALPQRHA